MITASQETVKPPTHPITVVSSAETLLSGADWNLSRFARNSKPFLLDCTKPPVLPRSGRLAGYPENTLALSCPARSTRRERSRNPDLRKISSTASAWSKPYSTAITPWLSR